MNRHFAFAGPMKSPYTAAVTYTMRNVREEDLDAVLVLNEASTPAVNSIPIEKLRWFRQQAAYFRVCVKNSDIGAFLIGLRPGTGYDSPNYLWFCRKYDDFGYVDRVAVAAHARRHGLATALYDDFRTSLPGTVEFMTCEVNIKPPNETSMLFHQRMGFRQVGSRTTEDGNKEVALLEKQL